MDNPETHATLLQKTEGAFTNKQSRDTGNPNNPVVIFWLPTIATLTSLDDCQ